MDKYIGFDVDSKKTVACVIEDGKKDVYQTLPTDPEVMRQWRIQIQHRRAPTGAGIRRGRLPQLALGVGRCWFARHAR